MGQEWASGSNAAVILARIGQVVKTQNVIWARSGQVVTTQHVILGKNGQVVATQLSYWPKSNDFMYFWTKIN